MAPGRLLVVGERLCGCPSSWLCLPLQEVLPAAGGAAGPEDVQCPGSTVNLRDLQ